jgi:hypothetical protein
MLSRWRSSPRLQIQAAGRGCDCAVESIAWKIGRQLVRGRCDIWCDIDRLEFQGTLRVTRTAAAPSPGAVHPSKHDARQCALAKAAGLKVKL